MSKQEILGKLSEDDLLKELENRKKEDKEKKEQEKQEKIRLEKEKYLNSHFVLKTMASQYESGSYVIGLAKNFDALLDLAFHYVENFNSYHCGVQKIPQEKKERIKNEILSDGINYSYLWLSNYFEDQDYDNFNFPIEVLDHKRLSPLFADLDWVET